MKKHIKIPNIGDLTLFDQICYLADNDTLYAYNLETHDGYINLITTNESSLGYTNPGYKLRRIFLHDFMNKLDREELILLGSSKLNWS